MDGFNDSAGYLAEGRHTTLPDKNRPNFCPCAPMPGLIIVVHGVNSLGEWYNEAEQGLCEGLDDRLGRRHFQYNAAPLIANQYRAELTEKGEMDDEFSAKNFIDKPGNSPVIRFRWGYKADAQELVEYESRIWLDQKTKAWGGGPFQNGTSCLSDLWNDGLNERLFMGVTAQQINPTSRPVYSAPPRHYFVHAADRLARLVERIRKRHDGLPLTIVCHSQGNMVGMAAAFIGAQRNKDYVADTYILCNPPYSAESNLMYSWVNGLRLPGTRNNATRLETLKNFVARVKERGDITRQKQSQETINEEMGFERDGKTLFRLQDEQIIAADGFIDRDNRGKVFLYCNPHDQLIGASPIQGIGWRGLTQAELTQIDPGGKNLFIRVWAEGLKVGEGDASGRPVKTAYHYWNDHWLTKKNDGKYPEDWWYPASPPARYHTTYVPKETILDRAKGAFGLIGLLGEGIMWTATHVRKIPIQATPDKDHSVPLNAPPLLTPVLPASHRPGTRDSDFDRYTDDANAVRNGDDNADRRLQRYEDAATQRLYEAQAKKDGAEKDSPKWKETVTDRQLQMMSAPPENATDHGTIVGNPVHCRNAMAWDVAIGICRLWPEEIHDLRKFADWRLGNDVAEEKADAKMDAMYFTDATYDGKNLKDGLYATTNREALTTKIVDQAQTEPVYPPPQERA